MNRLSLPFAFLSADRLTWTLADLTSPTGSYWWREPVTEQAIRDLKDKGMAPTQEAQPA